MKNSVQPTPEMERDRTAQVFTAHLALVGKDALAWVDLFAESAIIEFPYASDSLPRLEGKAAIYYYILDVGAQMRDLAFTHVRTYSTSAPNVLLAEVHGEATIIITGQLFLRSCALC
jgi:uncharacterized protein